MPNVQRVVTRRFFIEICEYSLDAPCCLCRAFIIPKDLFTLFSNYSRREVRPLDAFSESIDLKKISQRVSFLEKVLSFKVRFLMKPSLFICEKRRCWKITEMPLMNGSSANEVDSSSYSTKFTLLILLEIPAILISVAVFVHFLSSRAVRKKRHQHSVFVLLFVNFLQISFDVPISLAYYHAGGFVRPAVDAYCTWWIFCDYSLYSMNATLMAWISIERHLLLFHEDLLGGVDTCQRWLLHFGPWIFCFVWGPTFYIVTIVSGLVCINSWDFEALFCGQPCYLTTTWGAVDIFVNVFAPVLIISIANLTLIIRVIYRRATLVGRTRMNWRHQLNMVIQLVAISFTYLVIWLPAVIIQLIQFYFDSKFLSAQLETFFFLGYIGPLVVPFIGIGSIRHLCRRLRVIWLRNRQIAVVPVIPLFRQTQHPRQSRLAVITAK